jgi:hypothetical protein
MFWGLIHAAVWKTQTISTAFVTVIRKEVQLPAGSFVIALDGLGDAPLMLP